MPFVYIGKRHSFIGKSLWEIVGCLKNFGVGRMVIRNRYKRYKEPCFFRIVSAKPKMDELNREGEIIVDEIHRGIRKGSGDRIFSAIAYKTDYQLVPKHEESKYIKAFEEYKLENVRIYPQTVEMPPLLKLFAQTRGLSETKFKMTLTDSGSNPRVKVAEDGETPNSVISPSLGVPASPEFYEGILEKYEAANNETLDNRLQ